MLRWFSSSFFPLSIEEKKMLDSRRNPSQRAKNVIFFSHFLITVIFLVLDHVLFLLQDLNPFTIDFLLTSTTEAARERRPMVCSQSKARKLHPRPHRRLPSWAIHGFLKTHQTQVLIQQSVKAATTGFKCWRRRRAQNGISVLLRHEFAGIRSWVLFFFDHVMGCIKRVLKILALIGWMYMMNLNLFWVFF